ncbi:SGNH/GDSL hydrolase family protein [Limimaricola pyoseonensis]|uniref:SGNH/GDSL hydrolase family protein n=1 Tax=Limimaricola pyoseonensis TaxID=521013 RepID=UPI0013F4E5CD|nr:SGNH/GDSL hydrolase family protein [Limimaricola pyoseonensis]
MALLGTSLSARYDWPARLGARLTACLGRPVMVEVVARPGAHSGWGVAQVGRVAALRPDLVLIEFAINDADLRDGRSLAQAGAAHRAIVAGLRAQRPGAAIALMTMSPAQGPRGWMRPRLGAHLAQYRDLAAALDLGLVDLTPRWRALPRAARGLKADGLHPEPGVAAAVILPVLARAIATATGAPGATGATCAGPAPS